MWVLSNNDHNGYIYTNKHVYTFEYGELNKIEELPIESIFLFRKQVIGLGLLLTNRATLEICLESDDRIVYAKRIYNVSKQDYNMLVEKFRQGLMHFDLNRDWYDYNVFIYLPGARKSIRNYLKKWGLLHADNLHRGI